MGVPLRHSSVCLPGREEGEGGRWEDVEGGEEEIAWRKREGMIGRERERNGDEER